MKRTTIEYLHEMAKERGGKCLSKEFTGRFDDHLWRCEKGHVFNMKPVYIVRNGAWCPQCTMFDKKMMALELMQEWAEKHDCKCLSKEYIDNRKPLEWECKNGHRFKSSRDLIKQKKTWCPVCNKIEFRKKKLEELKKIAKTKGGKCLSDEYVDLDTKLEFECKNGHRWKSTPHNLLFDATWCPHCVGVAKHTIEKMRDLASSKKGKCLSTKYVNMKTPLKWQCENGHIWETPPCNILDGTWCPQCYKDKYCWTIEEMHELAAKKNGKCLSKKLINILEPLKWQCEKGHIWKSIPNSLIYGTWCPECNRINKKNKDLGC